MIAQFGKYAPYIIASYAVAGGILLAMVIASVAMARRARMRLAKLEAMGLKLRDGDDMTSRAGQ